MIRPLVFVLLTAGCFWGQAAGGAEGPPPAPAAKPEAAERSVGDLLSELEQAGQGIDSIRCAVEYTVEDALNLTTTTKRGTILYRRAKPNPMFLVHFAETIADDIVHRDQEWWLLRDRWLWEAKSKSSTIIKRELYREGEDVDFFDLERSPIPMPFGQKRDEIERSFDVRSMPPQLGDPEGCDHLLCRPKEGAPLAKDYRRLEYYVSRTLHLPVRIVAESASGDKVTTARFPDLTAASLNVAVDDKAFGLPKETNRFNVTEEPLKTDE